MRVVFAGTPEFAAAALEAIVAAGFEVPLVLTQPDRPAGRGMALQPSPVKTLAETHGLPVFQPVSLRDEAAQARIAAAAPDIMVVAAYGLILPQAVLDLPRLGCINIHASLLPRWRGAAPIHRAILAGDAETGICIMQMEAGLDTGPVLARAVLPIGEDDSAGRLHDRLAALGAELVVTTLGKLRAGPLPATPQPEAGVTYAAKLARSEAPLDFTKPAAALLRQVRAFDPFPGSTAEVGGVLVKVWDAQVRPVRGEPGEVLAADRNGILVACGEQGLLLTELQKPGGKRLPAGQFLAGFRMVPGDRFALPRADA
ncbi:methionyl-tRNA formyltransferase [Oryzomicrobium terrae]|uniref:Methionyl-tRNA formyltransferase n=1 Tax=Oryzomicrobium terrae TaxID=1735038 RepID=A0A5C1E3J1_9RHOO|nr:methionyl-tRNA formyltransferase [Oryzomicrobium terrae]QEL63496.1 methionyl-tRNA formyltransferase [Oryzomicrobium terrae]